MSVQIGLFLVGRTKSVCSLGLFDPTTLTRTRTNEFTITYEIFTVRSHATRTVWSHLQMSLFLPQSITFV